MDSDILSFVRLQQGVAKACIGGLFLFHTFVVRANVNSREGFGQRVDQDFGNRALLPPCGDLCLPVNVIRESKRHLCAHTFIIPRPLRFAANLRGR